MTSFNKETKLLKGLPVSKEIQSTLSTQIQDLNNKGIKPYLVVFLVGSNPASEVYVNNKILS